MILDEKELGYNNVGLAIKYFREKLKITQAKLCFGVCSISTLSRIESGDRDVDSLIIETLLERMGKTSNKFEFILSEEDYKYYIMREEINFYIENKEFIKVKELLHNYEKLPNYKENTHKQFILRNKALINEFYGDSIIAVIKVLMDAITCTVPKFRINNILDYYLSYAELNIIVDIAYHMISIDKGLAKTIFEQLMYYLEMHNSNDIAIEIYPQIAVSLSEILFEEQNYEKALEISTKGIENIKSSHKINVRGDLIYLIARIEELILEKNHKWQINKNNIIDLYLQAYYLFDFYGSEIKANNIRNYIKEKFQWVNID